MCAAVISANLPTLRPFLRAAASKLGITRLSDRQRPSTTDPSSSAGGKNTTGSGSTNQNVLAMPRRAEPPHIQTSNRTFYRLSEPDLGDMDTDGILVERIEHTVDRRCRSKESWYTPTTPDGDTDGEDALRPEVVELQPVYNMSSWK